MRLNCWCLVFLIPAYGLADDERHLQDEISICRGEESPAERLECYDQIQVPGPEIPAPAMIPGKESASQAQPAAAGVEVTPAEQFGKPRPAPVAELSEITAVIAVVARNDAGQVRVKLENGQVWRQIDHARLNLKAGDTVAIKAASLGSFLMSLEGGSRVIRVKRID